MKNEARRFINLIDALVCLSFFELAAYLKSLMSSSQYESRTTLHIHSDTTLAELFFPDAATTCTTNVDSLEAEALSEMQKEMDEPTRPNVSVYETADPVMSSPSFMSTGEASNQAAAKDKGKLESTGAFGSLAIFTGQLLNRPRSFPL